MSKPVCLVTMNRLTLKSITSFVMLVLIFTLLYWLTLHEEPDPCADGQLDVSGAVLADEQGDQDALINRAIIRKGRCKSEP